jgi:hypothetical protein
VKISFICCRSETRPISPLSYNHRKPNMDAEPADQDLLLLSLNLSDSEPDEAANPATNTSGSAPTTEYHPTRAERTALSEETFQALKKTYRPKIENGNVPSPVLYHSLVPTSPTPCFCFYPFTFRLSLSYLSTHQPSPPSAQANPQASSIPSHCPQPHPPPLFTPPIMNE